MEDNYTVDVPDTISMVNQNSGSKKTGSIDFAYVRSIRGLATYVIGGLSIAMLVMTILIYHRFHYFILVAIFNTVLFNGFAVLFTFKLDKRFTGINWIVTSMRYSIIQVVICTLGGIHQVITPSPENTHIVILVFVIAAIHIIKIIFEKRYVSK